MIIFIMAHLLSNRKWVQQIKTDENIHQPSPVPLKGNESDKTENIGRNFGRDDHRRKC